MFGMTRLRFLLLLMFSFAANAFGRKMDREAMAMEWLKANGFEVDVSESIVNGIPRVHCLVRLKNTNFGIARTLPTNKTKTPAMDYMAYLDARGFTLEEKHICYNIVSSSGAELTFNEVETAPPTLYRFTRPAWL